MHIQDNWLKARLYLGFTLFEVLIGISMCGLLFLLLGNEITQRVHTNNKTELRSAAFELAQMSLDRIRGLDIKELPLGTSTTSTVETVNNRTFVNEITYCERIDFCGQNTRHLVSRVFVDGEKLAELETVYTGLGVISSNLNPDVNAGLPGGPTSKPRATSTPIPTSTPTPEPTPTLEPTPTPEPTFSPTPEPSPTSGPDPDPTSGLPDPTETPEIPPPGTPRPYQSPTPGPENTVSPEPDPTSSPIPDPTETPVPPTDTPSPTNTPEPTHSPAPTNTPEPTYTPTPEPTLYMT